MVHDGETLVDVDEFALAHVGSCGGPTNYDHLGQALPGNLQGHDHRIQVWFRVFNMVIHGTIINID